MELWPVLEVGSAFGRARKERRNAQDQHGCGRQQCRPGTAAMIRLGNRDNMFGLFFCGRDYGLRYSPLRRACIGVVHFDLGDKAVAAAGDGRDMALRTGGISKDAPQR